jgi:hypothetical protein
MSDVVTASFNAHDEAPSSAWRDLPQGTRDTVIDFMLTRDGDE